MAVGFSRNLRRERKKGLGGGALKFIREDDFLITFSSDERNGRALQGAFLIGRAWEGKKEPKWTVKGEYELLDDFQEATLKVRWWP